jgi:hypothetical protein
VQRKKEKRARLADLQKKIDEAAEEMRYLTQDDHDQRPQHRELRHESSFNEDEWYEDFHHGSFTFDNASPLAAELQVIPWPQSYKPPQLPMYDGHSDPKPFLISYEATISSYGVMLPSWQSSSSWQSEMWCKLGTLLSSQGQLRRGRSSRTCWSLASMAFRRSQSQLKLCFNVHRTMRNIFRRMSEGFCA